MEVCGREQAPSERPLQGCQAGPLLPVRWVSVGGVRWRQTGVSGAPDTPVACTPRAGVRCGGVSRAGHAAVASGSDAAGPGENNVSPGPVRFIRALRGQLLAN